MGDYNLNINNFADIFTQANSLSQGVFGYMTVFSFFLLFFIFARRTTSTTFAFTYSSIATTLFAFLLALLRIAEIQLVWTFGILSVAVIMFLWFRKGGE
jgi:hypothetical protein